MLEYLRRFSLAIPCLFTALSGGCNHRPNEGPAHAQTRPAAKVRPAELAKTEFAMVPGQTISATTPVGTIHVRADDWLERSYTWAGDTRSVTMWPRSERWYGSLGVYYPGPGRHWRDHDGITRGVVQEGQQHFESLEAAVAWLAKPQWMPHVYTSDGLVVAWTKVPAREQLNVDVWQVMVRGRKPSNLPGASGDVIEVKGP